MLAALQEEEESGEDLLEAARRLAKSVQRSAECCTTRRCRGMSALFSHTLLINTLFKAAIY